MTTTYRNRAIQYVTGLNLSRDHYQVYESSERAEFHQCVLAIWAEGFETQFILEVPEGGAPVSWIPIRIFASEGGRSGQFRGRCVWFNPAEVEAEAMAEHNARCQP